MAQARRLPGRSGRHEFQGALSCQVIECFSRTFFVNFTEITKHFGSLARIKFPYYYDTIKRVDNSDTEQNPASKANNSRFLGSINIFRCISSGRWMAGLWYLPARARVDRAVTSLRTTLRFLLVLPLYREAEQIRAQLDSFWSDKSRGLEKDTLAHSLTVDSRFLMYKPIAEGANMAVHHNG